MGWRVNNLGVAFTSAAPAWMTVWAMLVWIVALVALPISVLPWLRQRLGA